MSGYYLYPEKFDQEKMTPELMKLWDDAMNDLRVRRNRGLIWQVPSTILLLLFTFSIYGVLGVFKVGIYLLIIGSIAQCMEPSYDYIVSSDRKSAKFHLLFRWHFKLLLELPLACLRMAKQGLHGLFVAFIGIVSLPIWWPLLSILVGLIFLNDFWWLKQFEAWTASFRMSALNSDHQHVRGTNILPSVQLSGTSPTSLPSESIEIAEGIVTLLPDGGIAIRGGATFDRNSTFGIFSINGVTLTRETIELLKVSHQGAELAFRFDGSSWRKA